MSYGHLSLVHVVAPGTNSPASHPATSSGNPRSAERVSGVSGRCLSHSVPHLYLRFGIWCCVTRGTRIAGFGYTAAAAYDEWKAQIA